MSDFISAEGWERPLALLARRHEVVGLQVSDPRESELPDVGSIYVEDAETGEQIFVDTSDAGFRQLRETRPSSGRGSSRETHSEASTSIA